MARQAQQLLETWNLPYSPRAPATPKKAKKAAAPPGTPRKEETRDHATDADADAEPPAKKVKRALHYTEPPPSWKTHPNGWRVRLIQPHPINYPHDPASGFGSVSEHPQLYPRLGDEGTVISDWFKSKWSKETAVTVKWDRDEIRCNWEKTRREIKFTRKG